MEPVLSVEAFAHVYVVVSDLDRSLLWYERVLGFELESRGRASPQPMAVLEGEPSPVSLQMAMGTVGGTHVELAEYEDVEVELEQRRRHLGVGALALGVSDIQAAHAAALAEGIEVETPPVDFGGVSLFAIRDPDGTRWVLLAKP